ncbi:class I SAM-dependent methyltransferase [Deinococcus sp. AJ005]|uniref:class I SAM-dependent methyltransferase n=1 Tax=Deinococcus sp. AJ005 TaxID=2652443 RepID=UPI0018657DB6|nr:class I SAM-dependent methyltransferase [Deinococcus sp. AJ005]
MLISLPSLPTARYDEFTEWYVRLVDEMLSVPDGFWTAMLEVFDQRLAGRIAGQTVLDVACGEGHLGRRLAHFGPGQITGVDISVNLLEYARQRNASPGHAYRLDDAQTLATVGSASVDVAVSCLALMDIPDHERFFQAIWRVLVPGGTLMFSCLHPCFEAPFDEESGPQFLTEGEERLGYLIRNYHRERPWQSGNAGLRDHFGAHHCTLSTLLNTLRQTGFKVTHLAEPVTPDEGLFSRVPRVLVVEVRKTGPA